jgi:acylphosphatase
MLTTLRAVSATPDRLTVHVSGRVQGVGFRWWTRSRALELGLRGTVTNLADGRVEVVAEGDRPALRTLLDLLRGPQPPGHVADVAERWTASKGGFEGFAER